MNSISSTPSPEAIVQAQLDAYNAKDLEALLAIYADDAEQFEHPATLLARGTAALRERFAARFTDPLVHATLVNRIVAGDLVIDHERIRRSFPEGPGSMELVALYAVQGGRIARAWFVFGAITLDAA
ncbi:nuclear transport factor 2 family protein [Roseateles koreensis]|uniref:Nuclear transport factor 2 family protein n=1 Tax=Roseateles koreensis TaxID=2987526 RepID=A0ABT5KXG6_9BURK|nr:nuclear transport factor 2 family protein [Roseateles koreensis]MDC8787043.1 nuclear transport factor 2 family protein [Roseateles koreensis]